MEPLKIELNKDIVCDVFSMALFYDISPREVFRNAITEYEHKAMHEVFENELSPFVKRLQRCGFTDEETIEKIMSVAGTYKMLTKIESEEWDDEKFKMRMSMLIEGTEDDIEGDRG